ncbi:type VI secretion system lipoprotein TssJ [Massilia endophytica]|uniref:type VI secretion system lipoprotein TssJ n=1 Tax=Massilia endophytica TaxID=2899220 RepID=UPI001E51CE0B|nr:type VI secretion system lipoprotein TssJ [Massilia endophytica]UGQ44832.1 type VI secretion system lipoprotein TssJ [Massilia endophytica]
MRHTVLALAFLALTGCGGAAPLAGAMLHDSQGPARSVPIRLHAALSLNSGREGRPLALVARIYKLRQSAAFERASFESFMNPAIERELLGADLIGVREVQLVPGQRYEAVEKVSREAAFIGVVALFREPAANQWRASFSAADAERQGITLGLQRCGMTAGAAAATC